MSYFWKAVASLFYSFWFKTTSLFNFQPHVIVHCAAERRPDVVENQPDAASQLNVDASGNLAKEAGNDDFIKST